MRRLSHLLNLPAIVLATLVFAQACGYSAGSTGTNYGSITLTLSPSSATIQAGSSTTVSGIIERTAFTGDVAIQVQGAPAGVTGTVNSAPVNGGTTASVTLTAASTATPGTYTLTVVASGSLISNATATFTLTIAAATSSSYAMSLNPAVVSTAQGGTGNTTVTFTRSNFTGSITPTVGGLPAGVTAAFAPNPATGTTSTLTLTVASSVPASTYNLTVRGTASGLTDVTTPLTLTVTAASGSGSIRIDYSACSTIPIWFAYQDGSGPWTQVTGNNGVFTFTIASGKGGFAAASLQNGLYVTVVDFFSQGELVGLSSGPACTAASGKALTGTVAGLGTGDLATISLGGGSAIVPFGLTSFNLTGVASGSQDLIAYRRNTNTPGATDKGVIMRALNVATGGSVGSVDFGSGAAFSAAAATFPISGGTTGDNFLTSMAYLTGASCVSNTLYSTTGKYVLSSPENGIPAAQQLSTDFHAYTVQDFTSAPIMSRQITTTFHTFAAQAIVLPAAAPVPTVTTPSGGIGVRRQASFTLPSDYSTASFNYADATGNTASIFASAGYLVGSAVTLAFPDFTGTGFSAVYAPGSGALKTSVSVSGSNGGACTEGATTKSALWSGTN